MHDAELLRATIGRIVQRLLAGVAVLIVGLSGVLWILVNDTRCDDSCSTLGGWRKSADAWQWSAMGICGLMGIVAAGVSVHVARTKALSRTWRVLIYCATALLAAVPWLIWSTAMR